MSRWAVLLLLALPATAYAQAPDLRVVTGADTARFAGVLFHGEATYPVAALEALGGVTRNTTTGARAVLRDDTLDFWITSPFFTAAGHTYNLAFPVLRSGRLVYLPEQFFIEWLPAHYPGRVVYRGGVLRLEGARLAAGKAEPGTSAPDPTAATAHAQRVVIIDPGHGGRDPGKVGPNGLAEKNVVLSISKRLATVLRKRGYEVHLTRTRDTLIALADRPRMANAWKKGRQEALFLSIHANSAQASAHGFETFFLSEARTADERRVAEMENAAVSYEDNPADSSGPELDRILNALRNDFYVRASNDLAEQVQEQLAPIQPGPDRGVKRAGFVVLVGAFMPAVLIETAFISNRQEARLLGTAGFQQKLAVGIADAVDRFFTAHQHLWAGTGSP